MGNFLSYKLTRAYCAIEREPLGCAVLYERINEQMNQQIVLYGHKNLRNSQTSVIIFKILTQYRGIYQFI